MSRLAALVATPLLSAAAFAGDDASSQFDAPVELAAGGNKFEKVIYPTPVLYDIDQDEQRELVIGDLIGNVWSCEPAADGAWAKAEHVKAEGKPLKLNNW